MVVTFPFIESNTFVHTYIHRSLCGSDPGRPYATPVVIVDNQDSEGTSMRMLSHQSYFFV
jgi:hypothetical protein